MDYWSIATCALISEDIDIEAQPQAAAARKIAACCQINYGPTLREL